MIHLPTARCWVHFPKQSRSYENTYIDINRNLYDNDVLYFFTFSARFFIAVDTVFPCRAYDSRVAYFLSVIDLSTLLAKYYCLCCDVAPLSPRWIEGFNLISHLTPSPALDANLSFFFKLSFGPSLKREHLFFFEAPSPPRPRPFSLLSIFHPHSLSYHHTPSTFQVPTYLYTRLPP